ncbi:helix-hairpin-helix domain-containing protein [Castellaniella sp. FW104-16D08]|uniref:ComEA family DNA-binding protein n=1 Tax=unclassified Castellaniella TaxID=2617606 RepID=UPI003314ABF8
MNPFLHSTVAAPLNVPVRCTARRPRLSRIASRVSRSARLAGVLALSWATAVGAVDLNTASLDQLRGIRGIGPKTAQIILDERNRGGRYLSFTDLSDRVRGIGPRRAQALQSAGLTIDGGGTRVSGQGSAAAKAAAGSAGGRPASPITGMHMAPGGR